VPWTVEHLCTYGTQPAGSLASAFLDYFNSYAAKDILRTQGYIPCLDRIPSYLAALCQS
jgi:phosphate transport system substrate-binding protein